MKNSTAPKPKVVFVLGILAIGFGFWFLALGLKSDVYVNSKAQALSFGSANTSDPSADSDGDGIKDWEEALRKINPKNPDTDGDGTPDGEEIKEGRDPLRLGPDDKAQASEQGNSLIDSFSQSGNLTELFVNAFTGAFGSKLAGGDLKSITPDELKKIQSSLPGAQNVLGDIATVARSELSVFEANNPSLVKKYFNDLYEQAYKNVFYKLTESDIGALLKYAKSENPRDLESIDEMIMAFDESMAIIKNLPVPNGYEEFTIRELDFLSRMRRADEILRNADKDPIAALSVLEARVSLEDEARSFHQDYKKILAQKGITFGPADYAYNLFK